MTTTDKLTLGQFLALPDTEPASEFACGEVMQKPMPGGVHAFIQGYLFMVLFQFLTPARLGRVGTEWRCIFGPTGRERVFVPDVAVVLETRPPRDPSEYRGTYAGAPDAAVEVMSPDQPAAQFGDKLQFYLLHGVRLVWVIDPDARTARVFRPGEDAQLLTVDDILDGGDLLPGFRVALADVFAQIPE
jgi:Uma2 family endonuclease